MKPRKPRLFSLKDRLYLLLGFLLFAGFACVCFVLPSYASSDSDELQTAIRNYRQGRYEAALPQFERIHASQPESVKATYYLAITAARLGHYDDARRYYNEVLLLDPHGQAATLSKKGLASLPDTTADGWDVPPENPASLNAAASAAGGMMPAQSPLTQNEAMNGMSQADWMALQSLFAGGGNQNGNNGMMGGMNPMMMGLTPGQPPSPEMMNALLMNNLMNNLNFDSKKNDD
jgi:tetratricopeptide (TPR) repeat protein